MNLLKLSLVTEFIQRFRVNGEIPNYNHDTSQYMVLRYCYL